MFRKVLFWVHNFFYFSSTTFPLSPRSFIGFILMILSFLALVSSVISVELRHPGTLVFTNKLAINVSKCHSICYSLKFFPSLFSYSLSGHPSSYRNFIQYLGVTFNDKLRIDRHCVGISIPESRMSSFILRTSSDFDLVQTSLTLFNSIGSSVLAYFYVNWSPPRNCDCRVSGLYRSTLSLRWRSPYM